MRAGYGDSTDLAGDRAAVLNYIQDCAAAYLAQVGGRAVG